LKLNESTKTAWLVMMMDFFHYIAFMCTKSYVKNLLIDAGASDEVSGVIISMFSLVQFVNALFLGRWIQKKGQKPQLVLGAVLYAVSGLLLAYSLPIGNTMSGVVPFTVSTCETALIAVCVIMMGTSHGIFLIAGHYVITGIPKEDGRDKYVGYLTFINSIGQFIGPLMAAFFLGDMFTAGLTVGKYKYVLLLSVAASTISLVLACIIKNVTDGTTKKPAKVGTVIKDGPLMKIVFLNAAVYFAIDVVTSYLQAFGEITLGLAAATATIVISASKFSAIFVRAFLGWLSKLFGSARLLRLSLLLIAITIFGMGLTNEISLILSKIGLPFEQTKAVVIIIMALLFGLANGLVNPLALIELSNASNSSNRSPALAMRNMCNSGGQTLGEIAFGYIAGAMASLSPIFLVSGTILFGCYLVSFDRKKKNDPPQ